MPSKHCTNQNNRRFTHRTSYGASYDDRIRSSDPLEGLGWDNLHVRQAKLKSILMYKILNENCSPCSRESLVRLNRGIIYEIRKRI